jgi:hypothetical protein
LIARRPASMRIQLLGSPSTSALFVGVGVGVCVGCACAGPPALKDLNVLSGLFPCTCWCQQLCSFLHTVYETVDAATAATNARPPARTWAQTRLRLPRGADAA